MQTPALIQHENPDDALSDGGFSPFQNWLLDQFHFTDLASGKGLDETALAKAFHGDRCATLAKLPEVVSKAQSLRLKNVESEVHATCRILFDE